MGDRRKRKSFWDMEEEAKHLSGMNEPDSWSGKERHSNYDDRRHHGFSSSATSSVQKCIDNSGRPSWESNEENSTALLGNGFVKRREDASNVKEIGGLDRFYKKMSPGFDGMERRKYDNTFEDDRSHSRRHPVRGRSPSRGKTSGRSRSRSLSRGRGRERERERERRRGWSRSRSRSSDSARGQSRSPSPIEEYRRHSHGWNDRAGVPDKTSQSCRDFVTGSCRRGSQCRFLHPSNLSHRDAERLGDDPAESWRNKVDCIRTSKHVYSRGPEFEMQDDDSEPHRVRDEQFSTKNRNGLTCKEFMRGNCRWADACRFSHHVSSGDSYGKTAGARSFDKDGAHQPNQYEKPLCKFFAAGKCDRSNCRFSHEVINQGNVHEKNNWSDDPVRVSAAVKTRWGDEKNNWSDDPVRVSAAVKTRWGDEKNNWSDDPVRVSDAVKTRWGDRNVTDTTSTGHTCNEMGRGMENEDKTWGVPEWTEKPSIREKQPSPPGGNSSLHQGISYTESMANGSAANKLEQLILLNSQLRNEDDVLNVQQQNTLQGDQIFSIKALQQNASSASDIQEQHPGISQNNFVNPFVSGVLDGLKKSHKSTHPDIFSGQNTNNDVEKMFVGHHSLSNETIRGRNMLCSVPSNEIITDLNFPKAKVVTSLNLQAEMQNDQKAIKSPEMSESKVLQFFPNLLSNEHSTLVANSPGIPDQPIGQITEKSASFLGQRFVNEQAPEYPSIGLSNSSGMMPSLSDSQMHVPTININNAQLNPVAASRDLFNPLENGRDTGERGNCYLATGTEHSSQIHVKQSSPLSVTVKVDDLKVNHPENATMKQDEVTAKPENEAICEQSKDTKENKPSETLGCDGKSEERNPTKDEKGMRLFKNALVEFVKEILKPSWKEGRMSREDHKTVVKKVVDKVIGTIQADHIPKTQEKAEHYLSCSKPKIAKLAQAYVERCRKAES